MEGNGALRAFAIPNYRIYFTGELVSLVGGWMQAVGQSWLVLQLSSSGAALGMTIALQNLPVLLFGVWAGVVVDKIDNRRLLLGCAIAGVAQALILGLMVSAGVATVGWVWVFSLWLGTINAFQFPAMNAFLYELVPEDVLPSAIGLSSVTMSVGRLIGPALAGLAIVATGIASCFYVNSASFLVLIAALLLLRTAHLRPRRSSLHERVSFRDGLHYAWTRPVLRYTLLAVTVVGMLAFNFSVVVPAMVDFTFHSSASAFAWVQVIGGVGSLIGGFVVATIRRPRLRGLGVAGVVFGASMLVSALAPSLVGFTLLWFVVGVASAMFMALGQMVLQHGTEPRYQGRVMSFYSMAWMGTTPIGALLVGVAIEEGSARLGVAIGAVATLLTGILVLGWVLRRPSRDLVPIEPSSPPEAAPSQLPPQLPPQPASPEAL